MFFFSNLEGSVGVTISPSFDGLSIRIRSLTDCRFGFEFQKIIFFIFFDFFCFVLFYLEASVVATISLSFDCLSMLILVEKVRFCFPFLFYLFCVVRSDCLAWLTVFRF